MRKEKFTVEYILRSNTSQVQIWKYLSSPEGLSSWFADDVTVDKNTYRFCWKEHVQEAKLISIDDYKFCVRFQWLEEEEEYVTYVQFDLKKDDITQDISLIITDFASETEKEDLIDLWNNQIEVLRRITGT